MSKETNYPKLIDKNKIVMINLYGTIAKGKLKNFKGFQRVNLNLYFLEQVIELLKEEGYEAVDLFVKKDCPIQIGSKKKWYIIAPRIPKTKKERYELWPPE